MANSSGFLASPRATGNAAAPPSSLIEKLIELNGRCAKVNESLASICERFEPRPADKSECNAPEPAGVLASTHSLLRKLTLIENQIGAINSMLG